MSLGYLLEGVCCSYNPSLQEGEGHVKGVTHCFHSEWFPASLGSQAHPEGTWRKGPERVKYNSKVKTGVIAEQTSGST